jgi:photosystem II stability/assembly factor-like uncharacterized protein
MSARLTRFIPIFCAALIAGAWLRPANADHDLDMEYAEHQPLVTESMLLDITRIGNTFVAVGERGHVVTSTDGVKWTQAEIVPTRSTLTSIVSAGNRLWAGGHDAVIITSGDKGKTWTRQFYDTDRQQAVMDIYFSDEDNGVAIGSYGLYLRTSDGGHNWEDATVDPEIEFHLNKLLDMGDGRWLIAGEAGYSYRSYDHGESWEPLDMPYQGSMWGALITTRDCALFFGLRGHVVETCDFGTNWTEIKTGTEASISGAAQFEGFTLLAANSGTILTRDDGGPFRVYHHSSGVDFAAAIALGGTSFLLVGEDGVHHYPEVKDNDE